MAQDQTENCPVCGESHITKVRRLESGLIRYECERCGLFQIDPLLVHLGEKPWGIVKHLVSAWIRRENKAGSTIPTVAQGASIYDVSSSEWWVSQYSHMGFPETIGEKLDALLLGYADIVKDDYSRQISYGLPHLVAEIAAKDVLQVNKLTDFLAQLGYIDGHPRITVNGWKHIDELRRKKVASNSAFIAMWFDVSTNKYRDTAIAAIEYCGYKAVVVDQQEYNDFIMNQVISLIRQSRFLVADFTCRPEVENNGKVKNGVRGGVYWEAGMAYGLGRPVIHTCEDNVDARNRIHFDVHQYNTIFWKEGELTTEIRPLDESRPNPNFAEKLAARILATVSRGSNSSVNENLSRNP